MVLLFYYPAFGYLLLLNNLRVHILARYSKSDFDQKPHLSVIAVMDTISSITA
jgi:hypothetical protein